MTVRSKIISYLKRCKKPKTPVEIARGAKLNPHTVRRETLALWRARTHNVWLDIGHGYYIP